MDLSLDETQQMLKNTAKDFFATECPETHVREMENDKDGYNKQLWEKIVNQGWLGVPFAEKYGGFGLTFLEFCILLEESGRVLLPEPLFHAVLLGGMPINIFGNEKQKDELLPKIISGESIATLAFHEEDDSILPSSIQCQASMSTNGYTISGTKMFVPFANISDMIITIARTGDKDTDLSAFIIPSTAEGVSISELSTISSDKQSVITLENVQIPAANMLGQKNKGWEIVEQIFSFAAIGKSCEMLGASEKVLEGTVEYAKTRTQFGRPIGTFGEIQRHCSEMATIVEGTRFVIYEAAWKLAQNKNADKEVSMAKSWTSDSHKKVCAISHQVHGGIGFTKEHWVQLYSRRAKAAEIAFGDGNYHREKLSKLLGLQT
jgi:alkylation response protein AidB-like acyl-CoA dehydrogenase